jgi:hypothetical protein
LNIEVKMILDFLGEVTAQEEVVFTSSGWRLTDIICFPEKHPLPEELYFFGPVLLGYLFRAWVRKHSTL